MDYSFGLVDMWALLHPKARLYFSKLATALLSRVIEIGRVVSLVSSVRATCHLLQLGVAFTY